MAGFFPNHFTLFYVSSLSYSLLFPLPFNHPPPPPFSSSRSLSSYFDCPGNMPPRRALACLMGGGGSSSGSGAVAVAVGGGLALSGQGGAPLDDGVVHGAGGPSRCVCASVQLVHS